MRLRSLLLAIVAIASLIMIGGALSGWPRSFAASCRGSIRIGCRPMWAKATDRSPQWSCRGRARFI